MANQCKVANTLPTDVHVITVVVVGVEVATVVIIGDVTITADQEDVNQKQLRKKGVIKKMIRIDLKLKRNQDVQTVTVGVDVAEAVEEAVVVDVTIDDANEVKDLAMMITRLMEKDVMIRKATALKENDVLDVEEEVVDDQDDSVEDLDAHLHRVLVTKASVIVTAIKNLVKMAMTDNAVAVQDAQDTVAPVTTIVKVVARKVKVKAVKMKGLKNNHLNQCKHKSNN